MLKVPRKNLRRAIKAWYLSLSRYDYNWKSYSFFSFIIVHYTLIWFFIRKHKKKRNKKKAKGKKTHVYRNIRIVMKFSDTSPLAILRERTVMCIPQVTLQFLFLHGRQPRGITKYHSNRYVSCWNQWRTDDSSDVLCLSEANESFSGDFLI